MASTPTTRSRTGLFLSYRATYYDDNDDDEHRRLISSHVAVDIPHLPPTWLASLSLSPSSPPDLILGSTFRTK